MDVEDALRLTNRGLIGFDLALGTRTLLAPDATLRALGHDEPSPDARHLFRRCGPIWLTFAVAHAVAGLRLAGAFNFAMAVGFGWLARERAHRRSLLGRRR
jgi:hypothetical protein